MSALSTRSTSYILCAVFLTPVRTDSSHNLTIQINSTHSPNHHAIFQQLPLRPLLLPLGFGKRRDHPRWSPRAGCCHRLCSTCHDPRQDRHLHRANICHTGNIGGSPIATTSMTGFSLIADSGNQFSMSSQLVGGDNRAYGTD
jgi:hypothetical protein